MSVNARRKLSTMRLTPTLTPSASASAATAMLRSPANQVVSRKPRRKRIQPPTDAVARRPQSRTGKLASANAAAASRMAVNAPTRPLVN